MDPTTTPPPVFAPERCEVEYVAPAPDLALDRGGPRLGLGDGPRGGGADGDQAFDRGAQLRHGGDAAAGGVAAHRGEDAAQAQGRAVHVGRFNFAANGRALEEHLYLVDPMGNWMMRFNYPEDAKTVVDMKRDLERLMRASVSWDKPGR